MKISLRKSILTLFGFGLIWLATLGIAQKVVAQEKSETKFTISNPAISQQFETEIAFTDFAFKFKTTLADVTFEYATSADGKTWSTFNQIYIAPEGTTSPKKDIQTGGGIDTELTSALQHVEPAAKFIELKLNSASKVNAVEVFLFRDTKGKDFQSSDAPGNFINIEDLQIVSRQGWGCQLDADGANPDSPYYCDGPFWQARYAPTTHLVVHHTDSSNDATDWASQVRAIWRYHAKVRDADPNDGVQGWTDIGYNYLIDPLGTIYEGRYGGEGVTAGHAVGYNTGTVGIAILGNYTDRPITEATRNSLKKLLNVLVTRYRFDPQGWGVGAAGISKPRITGHRDWTPTACPGNSFYNTLAQIRAELVYSSKTRHVMIAKGDQCPGGYSRDTGECKADLVEPNFASSAGAGYNDIAIRADGDLVAVNTAADTVQKITPTGTITTLGNTGDGPIRIITDGNNTYTLNAHDRNVTRLTAGGSATHLGNTGNDPTDLVVSSNGTIYVTNSSNNNIIRIAADGSSSSVYANVGRNPRSLVIANNHIYTANYADNSVSKVSLSDATVTKIKLNAEAPFAIAADSSGNVYTINRGTHDISKITPSNTVSRYALVHLDPFALTIRNDGLIFTAHTDGYVTKVQTDGAVSILPGFSVELRTVVTSSNRLYAASIDGIVNRYSSTTPTMPQTTTLYRFWNPGVGSHFYTASTVERDGLIQNSPFWFYEANAYHIYNNPVTNTLPVYRFWSDKNQVHFYTISEAEKNHLVANADPNVWRYEGIAFYSFKNNQAGLVPVYRFWHKQRQRHFYTISELEKSNLQNDSNWNFEGIAYYAYK